MSDNRNEFYEDRNDDRNELCHKRKGLKTSFARSGIRLRVSTSKACRISAILKLVGKNILDESIISTVVSGVNVFVESINGTAMGGINLLAESIISTETLIFECAQNLSLLSGHYYFPAQGTKSKLEI